MTIRCIDNRFECRCCGTLRIYSETESDYELLEEREYNWDNEHQILDQIMNDYPGIEVL